MPVPNPAIFGLHAQALALRQQRMELIASNIANADTPGYKAQDIDFATALRAASGQPGPLADGSRLGVATSAAQHIGGDALEAGRHARYERTPLQPSLDGNTVDSQLEEAAYAKAALEYRASLGFVEGKVRSLLLAITGQ